MKHFCVLMAMLLLIPIVLADGIGIGQGSNWVDIKEWEEVIYIEDNQLIVNLALNAVVRGPNRKEGFFTFDLYPERATEIVSRGVQVKDFKVCLGRKGGHSYGGIPLECKKNLPYYEKEKELWYEEWTYFINISDIAKDEWISINLSYIVPNFIMEENSLKTIRLTTYCYPRGTEPQHCPGRRQITKHIMLPPKTSLEQIPFGVELQPRSKGGWRITVNDFTPLPEGSVDQYSDIVISYIDLNRIETEKIKDLIVSIIVAIFTGLFTGIVSSLIVNYLLSKKGNLYNNSRYNALCNSCGFAWNKKRNTKKCYKCGSKDIIKLK